MRITRLDAAPRGKGGENPVWDETKGCSTFIDKWGRKSTHSTLEAGRRDRDGLGRAIALRLAQDGAAVSAWDLNHEGAEETAKMIRDSGGKATGGGRRINYG